MESKLINKAELQNMNYFIKNVLLPSKDIFWKLLERKLKPHLENLHPTASYKDQDPKEFLITYLNRLRDELALEHPEGSRLTPQERVLLVLQLLHKAEISFSARDIQALDKSLKLSTIRHNLKCLVRDGHVHIVAQGRGRSNETIYIMSSAYNKAKKLIEGKYEAPTASNIDLITNN